MRVLMMCLVLLLAGCMDEGEAGAGDGTAGDGTGGDGGSDGAGGGGDGEHAVQISGFKFQPADLEISVGDTVTWTNEDSASHTATAEGDFDSGTLSTGESYSFTFEAAGTFDYLCKIHPDMQGTIIVS